MNAVTEDEQNKQYAVYRQDLYNYIKETLSPNLTKGDLDIIIKLMCYIFGDLTYEAYKLEEQVDPDKAEEFYLRHLCKLIGYDWNEALTADQQRESIKLFIDIRRQRGTIWSLENLCRVFGQDVTSFYSSSDLRGVQVVEYNPNDGEPDRNDLHPGDLMIEVPQFSSILRDAIDNIRLIGTRIVFAYMIYVGPFNLTKDINCGNEVQLWFDPADYGYDPLIQGFGPRLEGTRLLTINDWPLLHRVHSAVSNFHCIIYTAQVDPYEKGFIWAPPDNNNYLGYLVDDDTLKDDNTMYR